MLPSRCCASVNQTLKSALKSLANEDAQGDFLRQLSVVVWATPMAPLDLPPASRQHFSVRQERPRVRAKD